MSSQALIDKLRKSGIDFTQIDPPKNSILLYGKEYKELSEVERIQGHHPIKYAGTLDLHHCNHCGYTSAYLHEVMTHLLQRHWLPEVGKVKAKQAAENPIVIPDLDKQVAELDFDELLRSSVDDLRKQGIAIDESKLKGI
jgi:hypothetical protein